MSPISVNGAQPERSPLPLVVKPELPEPEVSVLAKKDKFLAFRASTQPKPDRYDRMLEFLLLVGRLKTLDRRGWLHEPKVPMTKMESIAGHMYRMAVLVMILEGDEEDEDDDDDQKETKKAMADNRKLDTNKMIKMSLLHDMAECMVGDITPHDKIDVDRKHLAERNVMQYLTSLLSKGTGGRLQRLYEEYEQQETAEAVLVKELDRFDIMVESYHNEQMIFEQEGRIEKIDNLHRPAAANHHPALRTIFERIDAMRRQFYDSLAAN